MRDLTESNVNQYAALADHSNVELYRAIGKDMLIRRSSDRRKKNLGTPHPTSLFAFLNISAYGLSYVFPKVIAVIPKDARHSGWDVAYAQSDCKNPFVCVSLNRTKWIPRHGRVEISNSTLAILQVLINTKTFYSGRRVSKRVLKQLPRDDHATTAFMWRADASKIKWNVVFMDPSISSDDDMPRGFPGPNMVPLFDTVVSKFFQPGEARAHRIGSITFARGLPINCQSDLYGRELGESLPGICYAHVCVNGGLLLACAAEKETDNAEKAVKEFIKVSSYATDVDVTNYLFDVFSLIARGRRKLLYGCVQPKKIEGSDKKYFRKILPGAPKQLWRLATKMEKDTPQDFFHNQKVGKHSHSGTDPHKVCTRIRGALPRDERHCYQTGEGQKDYSRCDGFF